MNHFSSLIEAHRILGFPPPENPLISIMICDSATFSNDLNYTCDFYQISLKKMKSGVIRYGKTQYDHDLGSLYFIRPRQIVDMKDIKLEENGFNICFHEDFLVGHPLYNEIKKYGFFDYEANEALHLSPAEEKVIWELYRKIEAEYGNNQDEFSKAIMITHIDAILQYSQRFYRRQFIDRKPLSGSTVSKFNSLVATYFEKELMNEKGLPTVNYLAGELNLSPRYLSDLLKQETGKTAIELIHLYLISEAKNLLAGTNYAVSEIAYKLGFENPPYFSRLFKKETGMSPGEFRKSG
ncbi:helix-turn-helix domain-containing protein [Chitinophaga sancti]|uniref:Helix-turn-helix domain-containing protein n=1 Tax=Chitinophaga sancti TaxID=1004 RepID=A0A1K1SKH3_9BACT|nr:response regulator transcription factor [Chitinophaga sancti]WQD65484.1 helix-turn-helix transcriptional regulator [Chitinophaga sancti]WQG88893.1 helix-turn-helix transcriptional regulator [Chitinophaga sancti]SFW84825.1 Helix-turn-helix domain-containing protein [Chitinophaga sancti]